MVRCSKITLCVINLTLVNLIAKSHGITQSSSMFFVSFFFYNKIDKHTFLLSCVVYYYSSCCEKGLLPVCPGVARDDRARQMLNLEQLVITDQPGSWSELGAGLTIRPKQARLRVELQNVLKLTISQ